MCSTQHIFALCTIVRYGIFSVLLFLMEDIERRSLRLPHILVQLLRYGAVGIANTLITAAVIYVCLRVVGCSWLTANIVGYAAGVLNSFLLNSRWTFAQKSFSWRKLCLFIAMFAICYFAQLWVLWGLTQYSTIDAFVQQLIAMVVYNIANFLLNKFVTFRK